MRQIILDTETTGLEPSKGHKIIEIGCIEMIDRRVTNNHFHYYLNPERDIDDGAVEVHGLTREFLEDKPLFADIVDPFLEYVEGAELIIHNAPFDVGFINHEIKLLRKDYKLLEHYCQILDTLPLARKKHPGQRNSLDALCKRYHVDNSNRQLHGALLDSNLLANVYLALTGGQSTLALDGVTKSDITTKEDNTIPFLINTELDLVVIKADDAELEAHAERVAALDNVIWQS